MTETLKPGTPQVIWSIDGTGRTPRQAVTEFASTYWAQPRHATVLREDGTFQMRGGLNTYACVLMGATYEIHLVRNGFSARS